MLTKQTNIKRLSLLVMIVATGILSISVGCSSQNKTSTDAAGPSTQPAVAQETTKSGAQLWAETCSRCHNFRPPQYYSDAQWAVIVHHMRLRANLTGAEAREITKFLQSAN